MITLQNEGAKCLRGNHDNVMDWLLNNEHHLGHMSEFVVGKPCFKNVVPWWQWNGFDETLDSYGVTSHLKPNGIYSSGSPVEVAEEFIQKVPKSHKDFFLDLPLYWEDTTHFACHAYVRPMEELPRDFRFMPADRADEALWSRFRATPDLKTKWNKIGVFGHTPVKTYGRPPVPMRIDKIRLIDTGAFDSEYLCGYNCKTDDHILQATDSRDLKD